MYISIENWEIMGFFENNKVVASALTILLIWATVRKNICKIIEYFINIFETISTNDTYIHNVTNTQ